MDDEARISAIPAPADAVLPEAQHGALGIVMLDTRFPRPPGDVGHPDTFPWPVRRRVVQGAFPREIVTSAPALAASPLVPAFVRAMRELQDEGARAITTSCGFLVLLQDALQAAVRVPVVSSSLLHLPALLAAEQQVGVLTIDAEELGAQHFAAAGVGRERIADVIVQGVEPHGEFARALLGNTAEMDAALAARDVVTAAQRLKERAPGLRSVVLECTNMPPYAREVHRATGLRVLWLRSLLERYFGLPIT